MKPKVNTKLKARILDVFGSQNRFAADLDVDKSMVSRVVHRHRNLPLEKKIIWASRLKVRPEIFD